MQNQLPSFSLNANNAKQVGVSSRINEKGLYVGVFSCAEFIQSEKGTQGIEFSFKSDDGQTADYLSIWLTNGEGKELYGRKILDAIMTCLQVRQTSAQRATIKKYDQAAKAEMPVQAIIMPDLMGKKIGLMLVREEYEKKDGATDWKMSLVGAFGAESRKLPKEILEQSGPGLLDKVAAHLQDRPLKKRKARPDANNSGQYHGAEPQYSDPFGDMGDIPF